MNNKNSNAIQTYLSFRMGEEVFATNVTKVINIMEMCHVTKVPNMPDYILGAMNLRGMVLPVVDLRLKMGLSARELTIDTSIIVLSLYLDGDPIMLGALVDGVCEVLEIKDDEIAPSPALGTKYNSEFIVGMWRVDEKFIMILDIDKIFSTEEIIKFQEQELTNERESQKTDNQ